MGSVAPSSESLATKISSVVKVQETAEIIELGAGTGAISEKILGMNPVMVEIDEDLCNILIKRFPNKRIINKCAIEYLSQLTHEVGLVISIPLINNPQKKLLIDRIYALYEKHKLKWCVVYTYGSKSPLAGIDFQYVKRVSFVVNNIPPACIWLYK
jgi:phosphatidylethanolamine/phosphatidyl-N-methylethanolamine N-methyltransferase